MGAPVPNPNLRKICLDIIEDLHTAKNLARSIDERGITPALFYSFISENPEINDKYAMAQKMKAELLVEEIINISDNDELDTFRARLKIDSRKWYAKVMQPYKYGERIDVNINQTVDINNALDEAKKRVSHIPNIPNSRAEQSPNTHPQDVIDVEHIDIKDITDSFTSGYKPDNDDDDDIFS